MDINEKNQPNVDEEISAELLDSFTNWAHREGYSQDLESLIKRFMGEKS